MDNSYYRPPNIKTGMHTWLCCRDCKGGGLLRGVDCSNNYILFTYLKETSIKHFEPEDD